MSDTETSAPEMRAASVDAERYDVLIRLLKLGSLINSPMRIGVCDPCDISQVELKVLMALEGEGDLAGHELVRILGVPAMNISRAIVTLRERGLVEDAVDPGNRRRKPVRLSEAGHAAYRDLRPALADVAAALLGDLNARQRRDFLAVADRIVDAMIRWGDRQE